HDETGFLHSFEELNSYKYYNDKLNAILSAGSSGGEEDKMAAEGYGHLRAAMEVCVEESVFKNVVKRYRKGVAFPALLRIDCAKIEEHRESLNDIYEKCCVSIAGHSSPAEIHVSPTLAELRVDFDMFKKLRTIFNQ
ncbi:MAG TPA: hypothetical protein VGH64_01075, partial [Puia sp.]